MSVGVLIIGVLLLLTCNPIGIIWGGIMILFTLPQCLLQFLDYLWNILVAIFTLNLVTLFQLIMQGMLVVGVLLLILFLMSYLSGGQHGKH